jgi:hypothetical protein
MALYRKALALAVAVIAVGGVHSGRAADITIGINLPETGVGSSFGVPMMKPWPCCRAPSAD